MLARTLICLTALLPFSFMGTVPESFAAEADKTLIVYTARNSKADIAVIEEIAKEAGIAVEIVSGKAGELVAKLEAGETADIFITVDGGVLETAKQKGVLQPIENKEILANVPANLRDKENAWVGLSTRARAIVYSKERVKPGQLSTYEDLTDPKWQGKLLMRPGSAQYNVSLMASLIALDGEDSAAAWARGVAANFARPAEGNDRDQAKAIAAGTGDVTLMNTYYLGRMLHSGDEGEKQAAEAVGVFFPNQESTGTHINICGIALVKGAPNRDAAEKLIARLTAVPAQEKLAAGNYEYPVNPGAALPELLAAWGPFKAQALDFAVLGQNAAKAKELLKAGGWE